MAVVKLPLSFSKLQYLGYSNINFVANNGVYSVHPAAYSSVGFPFCVENSTDYFTFIGVSASYSNVSTSVNYACSSYASTRSIPLYDSSVWASFSELTGVHLPDVSVSGSYNFKIPLIVDTTDTLGYGSNGSYTLDWANATAITTAHITASNASDKVIISPLTLSDTSSGDTGSDYSQISNAIYYLGATILVVCFFSVIYKMFIRLRG